MLSLNEGFEIDRPILKCYFIRYVPPSLAIINEVNFQVFVGVPIEYSVFSLKDSYIELDFDVLNAAEVRSGDAQDICLVNLGPITFFIEYKLTSSCGKQSEIVTNAHLICFMYELMTSSKGCDDLSIGFLHGIYERVREFRNCRDDFTIGFF